MQIDKIIYAYKHYTALMGEIMLAHQNKNIFVVCFGWQRNLLAHNVTLITIHNSRAHRPLLIASVLTMTKMFTNITVTIISME